VKDFVSAGRHVLALHEAVNLCADGGQNWLPMKANPFTLAALALLVAGASAAPVLTHGAPVPEVRHTAPAADRSVQGDDQDDDDEAAPQEPELEQIPMVPVSAPESLAV
jgi:hypothetical protein